MLHTDAATAQSLRSAGVDPLAPDRLSLTVTPNLVPGEPFAIDRIDVRVDADGTDGTDGGHATRDHR